MKIIFYNDHSYFGQLNNNGGSKTIIKSAEALRRLGHKCEIVCHKDKFTWFKHRKSIRKIPDNADVCIAVGVADVKPMLQSMPSCARPFWWMRGLEKWQMPKEALLKWASNIRTIVNATHLKVWLKKHGIESDLCYSGLDLDHWKDFDKRKRNGKTVIGCLYNIHHRTKKWKDFRYIATKLGRKMYEYHAFGTEECNESFLTKYWKRPSQEKLVEIYNGCHIWFSPSTLEGFHQCPAEAVLCGCLAIVSGAPHSGTSDYITGSTGHIYKTLSEAVDAIRNPQYDLVAAGKRRLMEIGDREKNMKRLVEIVS